MQRLARTRRPVERAGRAVVKALACGLLEQNVVVAYRREDVHEHRRFEVRDRRWTLAVKRPPQHALRLVKTSCGLLARLMGR